MWFSLIRNCFFIGLALTLTVVTIVYFNPFSQEKITKTTFNSLAEEHIHKADIPSCDQDFINLGDEIAAGSEFTFFSKWKKISHELSAIGSIISMDFPRGENNPLKAIGFLFSSGTNQNCNSNFIRIMPIESKCSEFDLARPKDSIKNDPLNGLDHYTMANGWSALLMPNQNSCIVITFHQQP